MMLRLITSFRRSTVGRLRRSATVTLTALLAGVLAVALSSSGGRPVAAAAAPTAIPKTVTAAKMPASSPAPLFTPRGTIVSSSKLSAVRVFLGTKDAITINKGESLNGVSYPVATTDGGKTWRVDGSELHIPAANGPAVVTQWGAAAPSTYFIYGGPFGGNSVAVSTNGGKTWYRAFLMGAVPAVVADSGTDLWAFANAPGAYHSTDGGRVWHYVTLVP
jgi:hypothetical protein